MLLHTPSYLNKHTCSLLFWHRDYCEGSDILCDKYFENKQCRFVLIQLNLLLNSCWTRWCRYKLHIWRTIMCVFCISVLVPWKISSLKHSFMRSGLLLCSVSYRTLLCFADSGNEWTHCRVGHSWTECCISIRSDWDTTESRLAFITWHAHYWLCRRMMETACAAWLCLTSVSDAAHGLCCVFLVLE